MPEVRPFARHDREQLLSLANHHVAAVLPGGSIPASVLLSQMERDSGEYVTEPWVTKRHTIVGVESGRIVAAAHLKRYGAGPDVGARYSDAAVIDWILCWPNHLDTGRLVMDAALEHLRSWMARTWSVEGSMPCLGVYGIAGSWPHLIQLLTDAGFDDRGGQAEVVFAGDLAEVASPGPAPWVGLELQRVLGPLGTSFQALDAGEVVGVFEVDDAHTKGGSVMTVSGWADEGNHWVKEDVRGRGVGTWLFCHGCAWLRLGGSRRLLAYTVVDEDLPRIERYYARHGLAPINRVRRGWERPPS